MSSIRRLFARISVTGSHSPDTRTVPESVPRYEGRFNASRCVPWCKGTLSGKPHHPRNCAGSRPSAQRRRHSLGLVIPMWRAVSDVVGVDEAKAELEEEVSFLTRDARPVFANVRGRTTDSTFAAAPHPGCANVRGSVRPFTCIAVGSDDARKTNMRSRRRSSCCGPSRSSFSFSGRLAS